MPADLILRDGRLDESLVELQKQVRVDPANAKLRIFLFQLLAVAGEWNRAMTQLSVVGELDVSALAMVQAYREALKCEMLRAQIFAGQRSPVIFGKPETWLAHLMEALRLTAAGKHAQARELRSLAFEAAPATAGTVDGKPFEWIADGDTRLGPVLEAIVNGRYYWVPFHRIREIRLEEPADLRDVVWTPGHFAWANGGEAVGMIPTRYAGSEASEDAQIRMARRTEWNEVDKDTVLGAGQRMLATDTGEHALMDVRTILLETIGDPEGTA